MQNVKFPGLTFIILATSELEQLYFEMSISIAKCKTHCKYEFYLLQTRSLRPDVRSQDDGRGCVRGRGGGRPHGHHHQRVQQGAGGKQRGDEETVHEPPDIAVTNRCQLEYFLYIKSLTYQYKYFQPIKIKIHTNAIHLPAPSQNSIDVYTKISVHKYSRFSDLKFKVG